MLSLGAPLPLAALITAPIVLHRISNFASSSRGHEAVHLSENLYCTFCSYLDVQAPEMCDFENLEQHSN